ncbi:cyclin-O-like [Mytilus californianus]|uniref:cyclin-O-like n=1 Tax=Mytilus californianus TaxID=6549 RepID=UPI0022467F9C|nr:cyclin-O-like [Mytilus californianus]
MPENFDEANNLTETLNDKKIIKFVEFKLEEPVYWLLCGLPDDFLMTDTLSPSVASMLGQVNEDGDSIITSLKTELLDVDVDVGIYVDQEYSIPYTPSDTETLDPSLADSGFNDALSLQCLESVFDWKGEKGDDKTIDSPASPTATCMHHCLDHQGFEDYLDDIYYHRLSIEYKYVVTTCLENQPEVDSGMRGLLVSWMTGVHHQMKLCQDTLFIAVNIVDRVLDVMQASRDYLQLLGITTILIASKLEEVTPPEISELLGCCDGVYTREMAKQLERVILDAIRFDLMVPTSQFFLEYYATSCINSFQGFQGDQLRQSRALARCVLELSLQDYDISQRRPSMLSLCVWKIAVEETKSDDGDYLPPGLFHSCEDFEFIYKEVKTFSENLLHNLPDVSRVCEHYYRLYGIE